MKAIVVSKPGGPSALAWSDAPEPECGPDEVLVQVAAAGVNRADVLQRMGFYPPPEGASDIIGLECSGTIVEVGSAVSGWSVGDEVCALLSGGGYAQVVAVPAAQLLPVPAGIDLISAAALPEVACTVWSNIYAPFSPARLAPGETFLVHGGSSGIGTFAIQLAHARGNPVFATVGTPDKARFCRDLGAQEAINYRDEDFVERLKELTDGHGADVILDLIGAKYLARNISALAYDGRLVIIGMQGGNTAELALGALLAKRASVAATSLRGRPVDGPTGKAAVVDGVRREVWPLVESGQIKPIIDSTMPITDATAAHERMESSAHIGKILLTT